MLTSLVFPGATYGLAGLRTRAGLHLHVPVAPAPGRKASALDFFCEKWAIQDLAQVMSDPPDGVLHKQPSRVPNSQSISGYAKFYDGVKRNLFFKLKD